MKKNCGCCAQSFSVAVEDLAFYQKIAVPPPSWCPGCREMRRMSWCNEGVLYFRNCELCNKKVVSQFAPHNPKHAYCVQCWWSDRWDPLDYGREVELNRPFLPQLAELLRVIPHCHIHTDLSNENSDYTHHAGHQENCYMMFHCSYAEDCYYGYGVKKAVSCVDNHYCHESELCYECIDVHHCYDVAWCQDSSSCSSSRFLYDCIGCKSCFLCVGLREQEYCFRNEKLTKAEYNRRVSQYNLGALSTVRTFASELEKLKRNHPHKHLQMTMTEESLGNHLYNARESRHCFDCSDIEFSKYSTQLQLGTRYCHDIYQFGIGIELCYDCTMIGYEIYNCRFCYDLLQGCSDLEYCLSVHSTKNSFGCFGLKQKQYCILNKQYQREEYETLRKQLVEGMLSRGEYGSHLPIEMSPHGYNETMALTWYPKTAEEVRSKGWHWEDNLPFSTGRATRPELADSIADVPESITEEILLCETCARDYKITAQELSFYRKHNFPLPRECFPCRRLRRAQARDPRQFWLRTCAECKVDIPTTIAPERPERVLCEKCYFARVY